jgi:hypothetical protein
MEVQIRFHSDSEMMEINQGDKSIFYGNYWDFDASPRGLESFLKKLGLDVKVKKEKKELE